MDTAAIELPEDIEDLIYELSHTDGLTSGCAIHDPKLGEHLVHRGIAKKNQKGHYYGTELLDYMIQVDPSFGAVLSHLRSGPQ